MDHCTQDRLLHDVANHQMEVLRDEGLYRHLRFSNPGQWAYWFELITWPGHLVIAGDVGTYAFKRHGTDDMLSFFRAGDTWRAENPGKLYISPCYWAEKCDSVDRHGKLDEFDPDKFRDQVLEHVEIFLDSNEDADRQAILQQVEEDVLSAASSGEYEAIDALYSFRHERLSFDDFFDGSSCNSYTFSFLWSLYAISWGVQAYDDPGQLARHTQAA